MQSILEITISPNIALCVKAGFCQIQSHILLWLFVYIVGSWFLNETAFALGFMNVQVS